MPVLWVMLWSLLPSPAHLSGRDLCGLHESSGLLSESSLLKSLKCYNDYNTFVHCEWREHRDAALQLWFETNSDDDDRRECLPFGAPVEEAGEHRTVQCRYPAPAFSIGITHTAFFLQKKTEAVCTSSHRPLDLSQLMRARPPGDLSARGTGDGGQQLTWTSPYPSSTSSLNRHITYELNYRTNAQEHWATKTVTDAGMELQKGLLLPGCSYEAKVRARASLGHWSHWSPVVTWQTEEDSERVPSFHCVLDEEKEVTCSWEVSRELAHFITHQLFCRHNISAPSERCCVNQTITPDPSRKRLKYSCSLSVADPAQLQLELLPTRNARTFKANQHIRPDQPQQVKVREKGIDWIVEWSDPSTAARVQLYYQLCFYRTQDPECSIQNISVGSMSLNILQDSLAPSQEYQVQVRSVVVPGQDSIYRGIPSEWTHPVSWTSHEATWSVTTLIYFFIAVLVATIVISLYCTIPACQRRAILWVDSVPSPGKSKILFEVKSATNWAVVQRENTSLCKVQQLDSLSTCSSDVSLWLKSGAEADGLEAHSADSDTSCMSFSGPYIFCQESRLKRRSVDVRRDEKGTPPGDPAPPPPVDLTLYGDGYVSLPNRSVSRSTEELVSHSGALGPGATEENHKGPEQPDDQPGLSGPSSGPRPAGYSPAPPFTPWPKESAVDASGYCHLSTAPNEHANGERG